MNSEGLKGDRMRLSGWNRQRLFLKRNVAVVDAIYFDTRLSEGRAP